MKRHYSEMRYVHYLCAIDKNCVKISRFCLKSLLPTNPISRIFTEFFLVCNQISIIRKFIEGMKRLVKFILAHVLWQRKEILSVAIYKDFKA